MSTADLHLHVRVDADGARGTGHFMRCLALAQHWREQYGRVSFIGRFPQALAARLRREDIAATSIVASHPDPADIAATLAALAPGSPVVVDGYHFDTPYHDAVVDSGHRLLVVDDNAHLDRYGGHILLNQNIYAAELDYPAAPEKKLLGTPFAMLRREFRSAGALRRDDCVDKACNLLVTLGGADPENDTERILRALDSFGADLLVRAVAGPAFRHLDRLSRFCDALPGRFELVSETREMPSLMAWADLTIAAAGTTTWELAYMGVPAILVAIAENQEPIGAGLAARGAAEYLGSRRGLDWNRVAETSLTLVADRERRCRMMTAGRSVVDGDGAVRVAAALANNKKG